MILRRYLYTNKDNQHVEEKPACNNYHSRCISRVNNNHSRHRSCRVSINIIKASLGLPDSTIYAAKRSAKVF